MAQPGSSVGDCTNKCMVLILSSSRSKAQEIQKAAETLKYTCKYLPSPSKAKFLEICGGNNEFKNQTGLDGENANPPKILFTIILSHGTSNGEILMEHADECETCSCQEILAALHSNPFWGNVLKIVFYGVDTNKTQDNCGVQQHEDAESTSTIMPNLKDFLILRSSLGKVALMVQTLFDKLKSLTQDTDITNMLSNVHEEVQVEAKDSDDVSELLITPHSRVILQKTTSQCHQSQGQTLKKKVIEDGLALEFCNVSHFHDSDKLSKSLKTIGLLTIKLEIEIITKQISEAGLNFKNERFIIVSILAPIVNFATGYFVNCAGILLSVDNIVSWITSAFPEIPKVILILDNARIQQKAEIFKKTLPIRKRKYKNTLILLGRGKNIVENIIPSIENSSGNLQEDFSKYIQNSGNEVLAVYSTLQTRIDLRNLADIEIPLRLKQIDPHLEEKVIEAKNLEQIMLKMTKQSDNTNGLVFGPPGSGKTYLLKKVAKYLTHAHTTHLVLFLGATELEAIFISNDVFNLDLIRKLLCKNHGCDEKCVKDKLASTKLFLFIDGIDEILANLQVNAIQLYKELCKLDCVLWVTSQMQTKEIVLQNLKTNRDFCEYEIQPLRSNEQIQHIVNKLQCTEERALEVLKETQKTSLNLAHPMMLIMFSTLCKENIFPKNCFSLFEAYIKLKLNNKWILKSDSERELLVNSDMNALSFFAVQSQQRPESRCDSAVSDVCGVAKTVEGLGIRFAHQTIYEFFIAWFFLRQEIEEISIASALFSKDLVTTRKFFEEFLTEDPRFEAKLREELKSSQSLALLTRFARELMFNIVSEGNINLFTLIVKNVDLQIDSLMDPASTFSQKWNKVHTNSPLFYACNSQEDIALQILRTDRFPPLLSPSDWSVHAAAKRGFTEVAKILLEENANLINQTDPDGLSPLHYAVLSDNPQIVRFFLLNSTVDVNLKTTKGITSLHLACANANLEVLKMLLIRGAEQNCSDDRGFNALHFVSRHVKDSACLLDIVTFMAMVGFDVNSKTLDGETALSLSVENNSLNLARALILKGADAKTTNRKGFNLLHKAAQRGICSVLTLLDQLSLLGTFLDSTTGTGKTSLHIAAKRGHLEIVKQLIVKGASHQIRDSSGYMPHHYAASENNLEILDFLLEKGSDVNRAAENGQTALHIAASANFVESVNLLLSKGASVHTKDFNGRTPLLCAVLKNHFLVVQLLMSRKSNPNENDSKNENAITIASRLGFLEVLELLKVPHTNSETEEIEIDAAVAMAGPSESFKLDDQFPKDIGDVDIMEEQPVDWERKKQENLKRFLVHGHLNNLKLKLALHRYITFPADYDTRAKCKRIDLAHSGFFFTYNYKSLQCFFCTYEINKIEEWQDLDIEQMNEKHEKHSYSAFGRICPLRRGDEVGDVPIVNPSNYLFEAHRLFSFLADPWKNANITVYDLARYGFYFTGEDDNCRCIFCKLEVRGWEPGDTAEGEHRRWNPKCMIVLPGPQTENIAVGQEILNNIEDIAGSNPFVKTPITKYGPHLKYCLYAKNWAPVESLGVTPVGDMKFRQYSTTQSREQSFKDWPKQLSQKPNVLSLAGFFYTGTGDRVLCFQCGGGLKDWEPNDSPWVEHAKWFERCPYLAIKKGKEYISHVVQNKEEPVKANFASDGTSALGEDDSMICRICNKEDADCVNLPCGHMTSCVSCIENETRCIRCKKYRSAYVQVFLS